MPSVARLSCPGSNAGAVLREGFVTGLYNEPRAIIWMRYFHRQSFTVNNVICGLAFVYGYITF